MKINIKFLALSLILFLIVPMGTPVFAEKIVSIQKTVDVDKSSLIESLSNLGIYSQILPDYIQSSRLIEENVGNMKIGLDWISIDTDIKFVESDEKITLQVISGDFKGTTLYVIMTENMNSVNEKTDISAELDLKRSWHMGLLTSFVSDDDIQSMLHTSLNGLEKYAKNPSFSKTVIEEKQKFCFLGLCF